MTTVKQIYEAILVELNKVEAPSLLLEEFNYLLNKAILQYVETVYSVYDSSQQTTDTLNVLKGSVVLESTDLIMDDKKYFNGILPLDYYHLLNCIIEYKVTHRYKCYDPTITHFFSAKRLTADLYGYAINNAYLRPSYKTPYYYIQNNRSSIIANESLKGTPIPVLTSVSFNYPPSPNWETSFDSSGSSISNVALTQYTYTDETFKKVYQFTDGGFRTTIVEYFAFTTSSPTVPVVVKRYFEVVSISTNLITRKLVDVAIDTINSPLSLKSMISDGNRWYTNGNVQIQIRMGVDVSVFQIHRVHVDYLKFPIYYELTQLQLDSILDTSQIMEFSVTSCREIIKILTALVLENASDPRLNTNIPINKTT